MKNRAKIFFSIVCLLAVTMCFSSCAFSDWLDSKWFPENYIHEIDGYKPYFEYNGVNYSRVGGQVGNEHFTDEECEEMAKAGKMEYIGETNGIYYHSSPTYAIPDAENMLAIYVAGHPEAFFIREDYFVDHNYKSLLDMKFVKMTLRNNRTEESITFVSETEITLRDLYTEETVLENPQEIEDESYWVYFSFQGLDESMTMNCTYVYPTEDGRYLISIDEMWGITGVVDDPANDLFGWLDLSQLQQVSDPAE